MAETDVVQHVVTRNRLLGRLPENENGAPDAFVRAYRNNTGADSAPLESPDGPRLFCRKRPRLSHGEDQ